MDVLMTLTATIKVLHIWQLTYELCHPVCFKSKNSLKMKFHMGINSKISFENRLEVKGFTNLYWFIFSFSQKMYHTFVCLNCTYTLYNLIKTSFYSFIVLILYEKRKRYKFIAKKRVCLILEQNYFLQLWSNLIG